MRWVKVMSANFFFLMTILVPPVASVTQPSPNCTTTCGDVSIPFPFGTSPDCYLKPYYRIVCNNTHFNPARPFLGTNTNPNRALQVLDVMLSGQLRVSSPVARNCFNQSGAMLDDMTLIVGQSLPNNFFFSNTKNKVLGIGCDTVVAAASTGDVNFTSGCVSLCTNLQAVVNGSCSGFGCCQASIPEKLRLYGLGMASLNNHASVWEFDPCSYAFLGETDAFNFTLSDLQSLLDRKSFPALLDWAVGNETCEEARMNSTSFACQAKNSDCFNSTNGPGYFCNCFSGYQGNPYLVNGCQDINECRALISPCDSNAVCENSVGNFSCPCQKGFEGDGLRIGTGCKPKIVSNKSTLLIVALSVTIGLLVLLVAGSWIYWIQRKRKIIRLRENFFHQNGGLLLQQKLSRHETSSRDQATMIFTIEDLKKATDNYSEDRIIGQGGFGTVYKGILPDGRAVAIKKSKISDESQTEQFVNEVIILSQINHRNVVKLIGCCLETEVPSLVYKFITNGTLSQHIHDEDSKFPLLTWEMRLNIAADTAEALAYLHSAASIPIIHRDIKTANILLDDMYTAKVSDFGASKLVPANQTEIATLVQGTFGYLDPEYFFSNQLTEKSDVYSFGVVLVELLTGEKALSYDRPEKHKNLAMHFVCALKEGRLTDIFDSKIVNNESLEQMKGVANLAQRCLRMTGDERPTMKEVAMVLEGLKKTKKHPWAEFSSHLEETTVLIEVDYKGDGNGYSESSTYFDSLKDCMKDRLEGGR